MAATDVEGLIQAITEELYLRLKEAPEPCWCDKSICPDCDGTCGPTCAGRTQCIVGAGACRISIAPPVPPKMSGDPALASTIDHTLLKPDATRDDILRICEEARRFRFASVCINAYWVPLAAEHLRDTPVKVCTVVGFPLGATLPSAKRFEAAEAVKLGAQEVDMVINVGALRGGDYDAVRLDIRGVAEVAHAGGALLKVILETVLLDDEQKVAGCMLSQAAGADFVKTSTGFAASGATVHDVELMRFVVGDQMGVKAAGGVRSLEDLKKMISAGATRIGASASVKIMEEAAGRVKSEELRVKSAEPKAHVY